METFQFKNKNAWTMYRKGMSVGEMRTISSRSVLMLRFSQALLVVGFLLIFINNLDLFEAGNYFGVFNWMTITVFGAGFLIIFVSVPWLYFSSFQNFRKENDFWDKETFWIMPLFFFGTFFVYGNKSNDMTFSILLVLLIVVATVHFRFFYLAWSLAARKSIKNIGDYKQYLVTLKYLTAYYAVFLFLVTAYKYDPFYKFFNEEIQTFCGFCF